jgi:hypothetical protein
LLIVTFASMTTSSPGATPPPLLDSGDVAPMQGWVNVPVAAPSSFT